MMIVHSQWKKLVMWPRTGRRNEITWHISWDLIRLILFSIPASYLTTHVGSNKTVFAFTGKPWQCPLVSHLYPFYLLIMNTGPGLKWPQLDHRVTIDHWPCGNGCRSTNQGTRQPSTALRSSLGQRLFLDIGRSIHQPKYWEREHRSGLVIPHHELIIARQIKLFRWLSIRASRALQREKVGNEYYRHCESLTSICTLYLMSDGINGAVRYFVLDKMYR